MEALLTQGNSENFKSRFNSAFLAGLDYSLLPNHIHILLKIECQVGGASPSPTISDVICSFKSLSTKECKKILPIEKLFQRSFYDHIIRDEIDYQNVWQYIDENPVKWEDDSLYPFGVK